LRFSLEALRRTHKVRLTIKASRALPLTIFEQPLNMGFFNNPTEGNYPVGSILQIEPECFGNVVRVFRPAGEAERSVLS
jgi:hypothetical protein